MEDGKALRWSCCLCGVGRQGAPAEQLSVRGGGRGASVEQLSVRGGG